MQTQYQIGNREFSLDKRKAEAAYAAKRVINGRQTMTFNLLPLKYQWAYTLYQSMKADQWGPMRGDIQIDGDVARWLDAGLSDGERWVVKMMVGWLSVAGKLPGNAIQHAARELVTAPELKLVLGRHVQEENIRAEMLLYVMYSLRINAHACEAMFAEIPAVRGMNAFVVEHSQGLGRDLDLTVLENQKLLAKNLFIIGQCLKGLQMHGLFAALFSLQRAGLFPGIGKMLGCMLRNEANHVEFFGNLLMELLGENPGLKTAEFYAELAGVMREAVALEKRFIVENLPRDIPGVNADEVAAYVDHIAECRLRCCGLAPLKVGVQNPFPWMDAMMHLRSVPVTQLKATTLQQDFSDDEL